MVKYKYKYKYFDISIHQVLSTSSTDKYVLKYKYQVQVLYLTPTLLITRENFYIGHFDMFKVDCWQIFKIYYFWK